ncbi:MAG: class I SAM-dependent RNA methyltransferase [Pseudomonadota bacterium]|nr:class I SAM-dependent RNA methyltransferase [Pseudomonadota bacterium]
MMPSAPFEIFLTAAPGLEGALCAEAAALGFSDAAPGPGGVTVTGGWPDVWRANLQLRGASRVLARIGAFRVVHLSQLDKRARKFPWDEVLRRDVPVRVEASCRRSKIYHDRAAAQRVETALRESFGAVVSADAEVCVRARIEDNVCTLSVDTSGALLHRRGYKEAVAKAPMRETLASLFLRECGYEGREPVLDPMCGSGTFPIEAAEIAAGLPAGRARSFAFEQLATFDAAAWQVLRDEALAAHRDVPPDIRFYGSDRDAGAIGMSTANAERAGVAGLTVFRHAAVADLQRPEGPPGLVIVNPPYGGRIGKKAALVTLHGTLGQVLRSRFSGWRVGLVTTDAALARATRLPFGKPGRPVDHGGLKVRLYRTPPLK